MLYELIVHGTYFGQEIVNRFNYVLTGTPAGILGSLGLLSALGFVEDTGVYPSPTLFSAWRNLISTAFFFNSVEARAAADYDVEDFFEIPFPSPLPGLGSGSAPTSPVVAFGFRTNRVRLDIGRGFKRFAGVYEGAIGDGGILESATLASAVLLADEMSTPAPWDDEGNSLIYSPVIVKKLEYETPSGKRAYKYYPTLAAQMAQVATGVLWSPYTQIRTQGSRQYGHGS